MQDPSRFDGTEKRSGTPRTFRNDFLLVKQHMLIPRIRLSLHDILFHGYLPFTVR